MSKTKKPKLTPAEKMLASKRRLITRLQYDIDGVRADAEFRISKIRGRIRIAEALADALEKGSLKL